MQNRKQTVMKLQSNEQTWKKMYVPALLSYYFFTMGPSFVAFSWNLACTVDYTVISMRNWGW